ncbi:MAG TPA: PP2C family protein-serine/threonine phosphatase [Acidobacteriaceae bacterium]
MPRSSPVPRLQAGAAARRLNCSLLCSLACWLLLSASFCLPAHAREFDTHPPLDPHSVDGSSLGGPVDLSSTWLLQQGDDPVYAGPGLDDSHWLVVRAGRPLSSYGLKNVDVVWYRTHVHLPPHQRDLALLFERFVGSQQTYVNGVQVGSSGPYPSGGSLTASSVQQLAIPDALLADGQLTVAIRAPIGRASDHGGTPAAFDIPSTLLLGPAPLLAQRASLFYFRDYTSNVTNITFQALVLLIALALALTLRTEREYLALAILLGGAASHDALNLWEHARNIQPTDPLILLQAVLGTIRPLAGLEFVRLVLGLRRTRLLAAYEWVLGFFGIVVASLFVHLILLGPPGAGNPLLLGGNLLFEAVSLPASAGLPLVALWAWWKRRNPDALLLFVPLLIDALVGYISFGCYLLYRLHLISQPGIGVVPLRSLFVGWDEVTTFIFCVALLLFLVLRTLRIARARAQAVAEIAAAQTVQQVLLARASEPTPGFAVESVYHPHSEVGGDFFLVSPAPDGSLTAIVGDVSGKGLLAAMRVSMILGVLRREDSREPAAILTRLNEALLTQSEMGFTTACCVHLHHTGHYTVANAGHLSPYVGGVEVRTPAALPLGLDAGQAYETVSGTLLAGETLVLLSDGVVEARSRQGELYGFDRLSALTRRPAQEIAGTARSFGQEDDITVLTIACLA